MKTTCYTILISFIAVSCGVDFKEGREGKKDAQSEDIHLSEARSFAFTLPEDVSYPMPILPVDYPEPDFVSIYCAGSTPAPQPVDLPEEILPMSDPQEGFVEPTKPIEVRAWLRVSLESIEGDVASKQTATLAYRCAGEAFLSIRGIKSYGTYVLEADVINHLDRATYHGETKFLGKDSDVKLVMKKLSDSRKKVEIIWEKDIPSDQCNEQVACPEIYSPVMCKAVYLTADGEKLEKSFDGSNYCQAKADAYTYKCKAKLASLEDFNCYPIEF